MGGLHAGHEALIRQGAAEAARRGTICLATVFVNPTQFDVRTDFERYPRDLEADAQVAAAAGAAILYAPAVEEVYPGGPPPPPSDLPDQARHKGLEDAFRPGHFVGVVQVLGRLYELIEPSAAIYGEKDWQQLQVAWAMARLRRLPIDILAGPTVRGADGLALSSRNRFLSAEGRRQALAIPEALRRAGARRTPAEAEQAMAAHLSAAGLAPNYATVRHAETLLPLASAADGPGRALIACPVGEGAEAVRLLDNMPWPLPGGAAVSPEA